MPSNKWVLIAIGVAVGMFVIPIVPIVMGAMSGMGAASSTQGR